MRTETRPWGRFEVIHESKYYWLKHLIIAPGQSLSLQAHLHRDERWFTEDTGVRAIIGVNDFELAPKTWYDVTSHTYHRLTNTGQDEVTVVEWASGLPDEADIIRIKDDYGRL